MAPSFHNVCFIVKPCLLYLIWFLFFLMKPTRSQNPSLRGIGIMRQCITCLHSLYHVYIVTSCNCRDLTAANAVPRTKNPVNPEEWCSPSYLHIIDHQTIIRSTCHYLKASVTRFLPPNSTWHDVYQKQDLWSIPRTDLDGKQFPWLWSACVKRFRHFWPSVTSIVIDHR